MDSTAEDVNNNHHKPLPLRPQRTKPILKYSGGANGVHVVGGGGHDGGHVVRGGGHDGGHVVSGGRNSRRAAMRALSQSSYTTRHSGVGPRTQGPSVVPMDDVLHDPYVAGYNGSGYANGLRATTLYDAAMYKPELSITGGKSAAGTVPRSILFVSGAPSAGSGPGLTPAQVLAASLQRSIKATSSRDPYSRPISALDIQAVSRVDAAPPSVESVLSQPSSLRASSSGSSIASTGSAPGLGPGLEPGQRSSSSPSGLQRSASSTSIQTNAFMRPQGTLPATTAASKQGFHSASSSGSNSRSNSRSNSGSRCASNPNSRPGSVSGTYFNLSSSSGYNSGLAFSGKINFSQGELSAASEILTREPSSGANASFVEVSSEAKSRGQKISGAPRPSSGRRSAGAGRPPSATRRTLTPSVVSPSNHHDANAASSSSFKTAMTPAATSIAAAAGTPVTMTTDPVTYGQQGHTLAVQRLNSGRPGSSVVRNTAVEGYPATRVTCLAGSNSTADIRTAQAPAQPQSAGHVTHTVGSMASRAGNLTQAGAATNVRVQSEAGNAPVRHKPPMPRAKSGAQLYHGTSSSGPTQQGVTSLRTSAEVIREPVSERVPVAREPDYGAAAAVTERTNQQLGTTQQSSHQNAVYASESSNALARKNSTETQGKYPASDSNHRIRNPHYTPSKPYEDVRDRPALPRSTALVGSNPPPPPALSESRSVPNLSTGRSPADANNIAPPSVAHGSPSNRFVPRTMTKSVAREADRTPSHVTRHAPSAAATPSERVGASPTDGAVRKMPVTNTVTGTVFYRKGSKAEEVIVGGRGRSGAERSSAPPPKAGGRAQPAAAAADYGDDDDDGEEWEDDDDDDESSDDSEPDRERVPGDGEANISYSDTAIVDDVMDDDDEAMDRIDDDVDSDDGSDTYSIAASLASRRSSASRVRSATKRLSRLSLRETPNRQRPATAKSRSLSRHGSGSEEETPVQPALMPSLFPNTPPTINFVLDGEKLEQLPWEHRKLLKWRMSPITPNVVKHCIARSGFRATKKNHDWLGYWGKHMKAPGFKSIRDYQKMNHFPGSFQIGRKDRLWRNLSKLQVHYGKKEFGFFPQTFVLPFDLPQLKRTWDEGGNKQKWIIKPPASARGIGIRVIHKWNQIPKKRPVIVQRYLSRPYLINDSKFDLRIYVYITSLDPLRIYVYDDGLVRFASCKYSYAMKNLDNKYMHLTNYSINKKNSEYESNADESVCQGHKWGLKALWGYMKNRGINTSAVWDSIKDLVIKTVISAESCMNSQIKANARWRYCCHELFGFDVMLDENLKPWIIEVNISPSLHSNSALDMNIKGGMIRDLFNIAGFMLPDKNEVTAHGAAYQESGRDTPSNDVIIDRRVWPAQLSSDERAKHAYFSQRHADEAVQATILDTLTPDDVRMLVETADEDSRRGDFQRVFPSATAAKYFAFYEVPRYYNLLLNAWVQKYHRMDSRGLALLHRLCVRCLHMDNPTDDSNHQWAPPTSRLAPRDSRSISAPSSPAKTSHQSLPLLHKKKATSSGRYTGSGVPCVSGNNASRPLTAGRFTPAVEPS